MNRLMVLLLGIVLGGVSYAQPGTIVCLPEQNAWAIYTESSVYQLGVGPDSVVKHYYFGDAYQGDVLARPFGDEVPVRGGFSSSTPALEVIYADHVRDIELVFDHADTLHMDGYPVLRIVQRDRHYPLSVTEYIRVLPEYDLMEKWIEVENLDKGKKGADILLENCQSGSVFLPRGDHELTHLSGMWGHEYQPYRTVLTPGMKSLAVRNFKSYGSSFFAVRPVGETSETEGDVWFGAVCYSGNWRVDFAKSPETELTFDRHAIGKLQITAGANFWDQSVTLKPGEKFTSPKMLLGYTRNGMEGASQSMASYTRDQVLPVSHRRDLRPIVYNSWFVTGFGVNEENQVELAKVAKDLGVEMFVLDDGWFRGRRTGYDALGDWTPDPVKFPNGLKSMVDRINEIGLDVGLWFEIETVSQESDLFKKHPDWIFHFPNRDVTGRRPQILLNLGREDVYQYIYKCVSDILRETNIRYIKIDVNQALSDPGAPDWPVEDQRAVRLKYYENFYRLISELRREFPEVWFENCSGGGGRADLGMLAHMDLGWVSDNCDPLDRVMMQYSFLNVLPTSTMLNLVCDGDWHGANPSLEFKFDVAMHALMGVGANIVNWSETDREIARKKIALYKEIRPLVQFGTHYRLVSPYETNRSALQFVGEDKREAVVCVYNLADYPVNSRPDTRKSELIKLRGLNPDAMYEIEGDPQLYTGARLMEVGYIFPVYGTYKSGIFRITQK